MATISTNNLIEHLATDLAPAVRHFVLRKVTMGVAAGASASAVLMAAYLGIRPDMVRALATSILWLKFAFLSAVAVTALAVIDRLARPAVSATNRAALFFIPVLVVVWLPAVELLSTPVGGQVQVIFGTSAMLCPWRIIGLSIPPFAGLAWAVRGLAPTNLRQAGAAIGVAAGGVGALVYAFHCTEGTVSFMAIWYSVAILGVVFVGGLLGPYLLRWR